MKNKSLKNIIKWWEKEATEKERFAEELDTIIRKYADIPEAINLLIELRNLAEEYVIRR